MERHRRVVLFAQQAQEIFSMVIFSGQDLFQQPIAFPRAGVIHSLRGLPM